MVSGRTQKERRTQFYTQSVEEGEFFDKNGNTEETEAIDVTKEATTNNPQHRPHRSHDNPGSTPASDSKQTEQAVPNQTAPEDQVVPPKKQHQTEGTPGDTFDTPSVPEEQSLIEGVSDSRGKPQAQSLPNEQTLIRGNGGNAYQVNGDFETADGTLIVSPPYTPLESVSRSWLNNPIGYIAFGSFVTVAVISALIVAFCSMRRWSLCCRRRRRRKGTPWANEIKFHDEYTDEESDEPEDFHQAHYMIESPPQSPIDAFRGSKSRDWLGDMNFAVGEGCKQEAKNSDDFEEASQYDSDGNSLSDLLNGESPNSNEVNPLAAPQSNVDLLGAPPSHNDPLAAPQSPPSSDSLNFAPEPKISPPTVSEVFQKSMSPRWKSGKKPLPVFEDKNTYEELQKQQGDLNQALFLINDKLLEQQRELKAAATALTQKTTRRKHRETTLLHKKITEDIARLEAEKDDIDAKIKTVRNELKAHRHDRRLKLFSSHE